MLIENIVHDLNEQDLGDLERDYIAIEWYEVEKKVLHKVSRNGLGIGIRNHEGRPLRDGAILWHDAHRALIVEILPCDCIALKPNTMSEMAKACYEIGNRHAPLFMEDGELLTPFDAPLFNVLEKYGFAVYRKTAKLKTPLGGYKHEHSHGHLHGHS
ncbi:urease accessory protein UreE [Desulfoscipio geothermicus]|uniref:Urease accessory protein UreE n=1 Tax=Desulfoscipio geothermicus DSM 3669 TaxID=1121426 RepID=A0A1I6E9Z6_9FIRM|nr:urease accessory protein UreE [Desulfoscipio geothermicus]SFR14583.1 urease accessory protein [Desulfoscipio geothermicus DSM 3669]